MYGLRERTLEITFAGRDELILIPPAMLAEVFRQGYVRERMLLRMKDFFSPGLREYLEKVLSDNRHLLSFSYEELSEGIPGEEEICRIVSRQLLRMRINGMKCFYHTEYEESPADGYCITAAYTREVRELRKMYSLLDIKCKAYYTKNVK